MAPGMFLAQSVVPSSRIDGDVHFRSGSGADLLANEEHRRFVHFALADHHGAVDRKPAQFAVHGVDGGLIRHFFRAASAQSRSRHCGSLRHPHDLERQRAPEARVLACVLTRVLGGRLRRHEAISNGDKTLAARS